MTKLMIAAAVLILTHASSVLAYGSSYSYSYAEANSYDLEHSIMQAAVKKITDCAVSGRKTCVLQISNDSKNKIKDYLTLKYDFPVTTTKNGLDIDLSAAQICATKVNKLMNNLKLRVVNENERTISKQNIFKENGNWSLLCTFKDTYWTLNLEKILSYDADITYRDPKIPMSFSEDTVSEVNDLVTEFKSIFNSVTVRNQNYQVAVRKERQNFFNNTELYWSSTSKSMPMIIEYGNPK